MIQSTKMKADHTTTITFHPLLEMWRKWLYLPLIPSHITRGFCIVLDCRGFSGIDNPREKCPIPDTCLSKLLVPE